MIVTNVIVTVGTEEHGYFDFTLPMLANNPTTATKKLQEDLNKGNNETHTKIMKEFKRLDFNPYDLIGELV
jgi:hypothetical protein